VLFNGAREGTFFCLYYPFALGVILSPDASMTLFFEIGNQKNGEYPWVDPFFARKKTSSPAKGNKPESGSVLDAGMLVNRVMSIVCPPREKIPSMCTRNLKNPPDNSTGLFLFNGVPRGAFLAHSTLWRPGYAGTRCAGEPPVSSGSPQYLHTLQFQ